MTDLTRRVNSQESAGFRRDGVVVLKKVVSRDLVEAIAGQMDQVRTDPGDAVVRMFDKNGGCMIAEQHSCLQRPVLKKLVQHAGFGKMATELYGGEDWRFLGDQSWIKEAGPMLPTPWHQDHGYSNLNGRDLIRIWIPCDPVPGEQALEFVRGSHLWNVEFKPAVEPDESMMEEGDSVYAYGPYEEWNDSLPHVPDIAGHRDSFDIMGCPCEPGDLVVFHFRTLHSAGFQAKRANLRRAFSITLGGADAHLVKRPGKTLPTRLDLMGIDYESGSPASAYPKAFPAVT